MEHSILAVLELVATFTPETVPAIIGDCTMGISDTASRTACPSLSFQSGLVPLLTFIVLVASFPTVSFLVSDWLFKNVVDGQNLWLRIGLTIVNGVILLGITWIVLRWEGVSLHEVGFSMSHARSGVSWYLSILLALNLALLLVAAGVADRYFVSFAGMSPAGWLGLAVAQWLFVGIAEELGGRAYLQNKLIALFDGGDDIHRKGMAIVTMAVLFALWHIPQRLLRAQLTPSQLPMNLVQLVGVAIIFGVLYELTRNVVFVGLLHGAYNHPPILLEVHFQGNPGPVVSIAILVVILLPFIVGVWAYHKWARQERRDDFRKPTRG